MAEASNGSVLIHYDVQGPAEGVPLLLIMGLGAQMIAWQDGFCQMLVDAGHRVIRFDNRDAGLSSKTASPPPEVGDLARLLVGRGIEMAPYTLSDMASDAVAVLDAEGCADAHIVGASLGGMVAQTLAIEHPGRCRSLTSIMSKPGSPFSGTPAPQMVRMLMTDRPEDPADALETDLARFEMIAGPLFERERMREYVKRANARSYYPAGAKFQLAAMFASGDRTGRLRKLDLPTLVIHGRRDRLVRPSGGVATARAIPGSQLIMFDEMGHDLPRLLWPRMTGAIGLLAADADARIPAASQLAGVGG
jgi:pimeloyl-ACP methyl ester carboxylesterase